jgi:tetratricopeptide (TPR) repeat protein
MSGKEGNIWLKRSLSGSRLPVIFLFLLLNFICSQAKSQDTLNSLVVEQKSYQLYTDKNWSELITYGNTAVKKGYDYFYMRMRIGIAYYEKKNYCAAESHFIKALEFNNGDELALEYLYYSYIFVGRNEDARKLSRTFGKDLIAKIGIDKLSDVNFFMFEGGIKMANSAAHSQITSGSYIKANLTTNYPTGNNYVLSPAKYFQAGLNHSVKNKYALFHALTYFNQSSSVDSSYNSKQQLSWYFPPKAGDTTITAVTGIHSKHNYTLTQLQYYLKAAIPLKNDWMISPSLGIVHTGLTDIPEITSTPPSSRPPPPPIFVHPKPNDKPIAAPAYRVGSDHIIGSVSLQKICNKFTFTVGSTFSNMSQTEVDERTNQVKTTSPVQFINSGAIYYSPLGNGKLVFGCTGYAHTITSYQTTYAAFSPFLFVQPAKFFSLKLAYFANAGKNIIEDNGFFVNNSSDLTTSRISVLANFYLSKSISLYASYLLENKLESVHGFDYKYNIAVIGLKFVPKHKK